MKISGFSFCEALHQLFNSYRVPQKKLPLVKVSRGKYYCWQWEIHIELLQTQVKFQAVLWRQVNVWVHVMNLSHIVLLFFKLDVVLLSLCHCLICNPTRWYIYELQNESPDPVQSSTNWYWLILTKYNQVPTGTDLNWPSTNKYQPASPYTDPIPPYRNQIPTIAALFYWHSTQRHHLATHSWANWI